MKKNTTVRAARFVLVAAMVVVAGDSQSLMYGQEPATVKELVLELAGDPEKLPPGVSEKPHILLISGDEEYRSEEALPLLAQILSSQHGMDCTVSFSVNPETNSIDPNYTQNQSGLSKLPDADAVILFTRFRQWPDDQMKLFEDYVLRGGPILALRTATHPFNFPGNSNSAYKDWSWNNSSWAGGFGQQIIGETWHSHHGKHKSESARAVVADGKQDSPLLRGVGDMWAPTDVYGVVHLPEDANILLRGQILAGMSPEDPPVDDGRNDPMMPLAWTKNYRYKDGQEGKVFCSTMCSSIDLQDEDIRRFIVNATYWAIGWEDKIPEKASVEIPGKYEPTMFGFQTAPGFFSKKNLHPEDFLVK